MNFPKGFIIYVKLQAQKAHGNMEPKDLEDENEGSSPAPPPSSLYELHKSMNVNSNKKTFHASSLRSCLTCTSQKMLLATYVIIPKITNMS